MESEADQYQGLPRRDSGKREETEDNTDVVVVVESCDVCHSPGTIDELNQMYYNYSGTKLGSFVARAPTPPPLSPLWNLYGDCQNHAGMRYYRNGIIASALRHWRILKVVVVHVPGIRHELARNAVKKEIFGEVFSDEVCHCHAPETLGDCLADKGKEVISDHNHLPSCSCKSGCPKAIALGNENGMGSFDTKEDNCHYNKLNLTGDINNLDQEKNSEIVNNENEVVKVENNHTGDRKGLLNLEKRKRKRTSQSKHVKAKGLTLADIQNSRAEGMKLQDAVDEFNVSRSTIKRICREHGIKDWRVGKKVKSPCLKQPKDSLEHFNKTLDASEPTLFDEALVGGSSGAREDRDSSIFDVKATYEKSGRKIRFSFASTSTIDQLKEDVGRRLNLERNEFEIQFLDNEDDWVDMVLPEDLQLCLSLSSSPGNNLVRLKILDF